MPRTTFFSIGERFESSIASEVASGRHHNASKVTREALSLPEEQTQERTAKFDAIRAILIRSEESGNAEPFDLERIKANVRKRVAERNRSAGSK